MQEVIGSTPLSSTFESPAGLFFMYFVCVVYSKNLDRYYTGYTEDLNIRLHNSGASTFTSKATDWVLCFSEPYPTRAVAQAREREIKNKKRGNILNGSLRASLSACMPRKHSGKRSSVRLRYPPQVLKVCSNAFICRFSFRG
jgi:putative endonuclease